MSLDSIYHSTSTFVLSGGLSKRMGEPKALIKLGHLTLLERTVLLGKSISKKIYLSSNERAISLPKIESVSDEIPNCGPLGGIYSCLIQTKTDWNFFVPCDAPFLKPQLFHFLYSHQNTNQAVIPVFNGQIEPLAGLYNRSIITEIQESIDNNRLGLIRFLKSIQASFIDIETSKIYPDHMFLNCNTTDDIVKAENIITKPLKEFNNILLIAGEGRNAGKTTVAESIIEKLSKKRKVNSLKICPHFHSENPNKKGYFLMQETEDNSKDSGRFLQAGANKSFYAEATDIVLPDLIEDVISQLPADEPIIIESGGLSHYLKPGQIIFCEGETSSKKYNQIESNKNTIILPYNSEVKKHFVETIYFENNRFTIKPTS